MRSPVATSREQKLDNEEDWTSGSGVGPERESKQMISSLDMAYGRDGNVWLEEVELSRHEPVAAFFAFLFISWLDSPDRKSTQSTS